MRTLIFTLALLCCSVSWGWGNEVADAIRDQTFQMQMDSLNAQTAQQNAALMAMPVCPVCQCPNLASLQKENAQLAAKASWQDQMAMQVVLERDSEIRALQIAYKKASGKEWSFKRKFPIPPPEGSF